MKDAHETDSGKQAQPAAHYIFIARALQAFAEKPYSLLRSQEAGINRVESRTLFRCSVASSIIQSASTISLYPIRCVDSAPRTKRSLVTSGALSCRVAWFFSVSNILQISTLKECYRFETSRASPTFTFGLTFPAKISILRLFRLDRPSRPSFLITDSLGVPQQPSLVHHSCFGKKKKSTENVSRPGTNWSHISGTGCLFSFFFIRLCYGVGRAPESWLRPTHGKASGEAGLVPRDVAP